jgi:hypothetical protein
VECACEVGDVFEWEMCDVGVMGGNVAWFGAVVWCAVLLLPE